MQLGYRMGRRGSFGFEAWERSPVRGIVRALEEVHQWRMEGLLMTWVFGRATARNGEDNWGHSHLTDARHILGTSCSLRTLICHKGKTLGETPYPSLIATVESLTADSLCHGGGQGWEE